MGQTNNSGLGGNTKLRALHRESQFLEYVQWEDANAVTQLAMEQAYDKLMLSKMDAPDCNDDRDPDAVSEQAESARDREPRG